ncbi:MAG: hypothetical protein K0S53_1981 [Bacteroidetes bacterium]|jgi:hypothetical protein|nr:hypothetical protein [Bacteroidota bacterium]
MKVNFSYIALSFISIISLISCKNDLDVLAPGEESVSVYGVLNPNEPVQKIRINKVFLTDGDALEVAQDPNQINYGPGELHVTLQRFMSASSTTPTLTTVGNATRKEIVLTETVVTTAGGNFSQEQRLWQTSDKLYTSGEYRLLIKNVSSGKEFTAQSIMIDSVKSHNIMPFIFIPNTYPVHCGVGNAGYVAATIPGTGTQPNAYINYNVLSQTKKIIFKSVPNAKLYKVTMRFHYIDSLMGGAGIRNYVDMSFPSLTSTTIAGNEELSVSFGVADFYSLLASEIPKKTTGSIRHRTAHYMEYIIEACSENMSTFLLVNQPSTTIAQDKPNYTNIVGGTGIFASTSKTSLGKELWSDFIDELSNNSTTSSLQFIKRYKFICP